MDPRTVFIQTNKSQRLGALLSKYSIERFLNPGDGITVDILQVEDMPEFQAFVGRSYKQGSDMRTYRLEDEQSFTLTRFVPPERMGYQGRAVVIDPDVFAVRDIRGIFDTDLGGHAVACCERGEEKKFWDTSVMLLECRALDWKIAAILDDLSSKKRNYNHAIRDVLGASVLPIPRIWNTLDDITPDTRFVHMTRQRTQPWKTGLPFTVTPRTLGKLFGIIPKELLPYGKHKYPATYQEHENDAVKEFFFGLVRDALRDNAVDRRTIETEIAEGRIRKDLFDYV